MSEKEGRFKLVNKLGHELVKNGNVLRHFFVEKHGDVYNYEQLLKTIEELEEEKIPIEKLEAICAV